MCTPRLLAEIWDAVDFVSYCFFVKQVFFGQKGRQKIDKTKVARGFGKLSTMCAQSTARCPCTLTGIAVFFWSAQRVDSQIGNPAFAVRMLYGFISNLCSGVIRHGLCRVLDVTITFPISAQRTRMSVFCPHYTKLCIRYLTRTPSVVTGCLPIERHARCEEVEKRE